MPPILGNTAKGSESTGVRSNAYLATLFVIGLRPGQANGRSGTGGYSRRVSVMIWGFFMGPSLVAVAVRVIVWPLTFTV